MDSFFTLNDVPMQEKYEIVMVIDNCTPVMRRMGDLGFCVGNTVVPIKKSVLSKSILVCVNGVNLITRSNLAKLIIVQKAQ